MPSPRVPAAPSRRLLRSVAVASALACSAAVSAVLPGAVAAADELTGTAVVGELVQVWAEDEHQDAVEPAHAADGPLSFVQTAAGEAVRVPTEDVSDLPAGATVSVTVGAQVDDEAADEHGVEPARTVLSSNLVAAPVEPAAPAMPRAGLTNEVTVVLVAPAGAPEDSTTLADVVDLVDGPVADFWAEQSNGAITVGVTAARDWTTTAAGCADPIRLWDEAAAAVRFVPGAGKHLMLYVTQAARDCAYALAEVGSAPATGGRLYVRDTLASVIAHELGHNFGLGHSSARQCDAAVETGDCRTAAYRDFYDVMGASWDQLGSLNAAQAARLDLLPADQVRTLSVQDPAATVTLAPLGGPTGIRALRLTDAGGVDYWLEYRAPAGRDAWLGTKGNRYGLDSGVLLRQAGTNLPDTSLLLDGTPAPTAGWAADHQSALPVGSEVPVSGGRFSVSVQGLSAVGAVVSVIPVAGGISEPAPAPVEVAPGTLMSGSGPVAAADGGGPVVLDAVPAQVRLVTAQQAVPALESAAGASTAAGFLVPLGGAVLAGTALLAVRRLRKVPLRLR